MYSYIWQPVGRPLLAALFVTAIAAIAACGGGGGGHSQGSGASSSASFSSSSSQSSARVEQPLPALNLSMVNGAGIEDKDNYVNGTITLTEADGTVVHTGSLEVKGRGNSTWYMAKKPYRLKLESKASLMGMPSSRHWVLLANYADKSLLRNRTALELSKRLEMAWTPRAVSVEVTLNGEYLGVYDLVEHIRVDKDRVNITEIDEDTSEDPAKGGYLLEVDERMGENICWHTSRGVPFCLNTPENGHSGQQIYIRTYVQDAEDSIFSADTQAYRNYIDLDSLIDWYLINELFKNPDSTFFSSVYMFKDADTKLTFGPVWDFDISAGNADYLDYGPEGWYVATSRWPKWILTLDPEIKPLIRARWDAIKATHIDSLPDYVREQARAYDKAQARNFTRWPILGVYVWPNAAVKNSYAEEVEYLADWLDQRIAWMDGNL